MKLGQSIPQIGAIVESKVSLGEIFGIIDRVRFRIFRSRANF